MERNENKKTESYIWKNVWKLNNTLLHTGSNRKFEEDVQYVLKQAETELQHTKSCGKNQKE